MNPIYNAIIDATTHNKKLLAVLIDPDKMTCENAPSFIEKVNTSIATHIFIGGSEVDDLATHKLVTTIQQHTQLPIVLFPGDIAQITNTADALLFLSLLSGQNPDYLINKHIQAVTKLRNSNLEIIPTGYILIENGKQTAVQRVTNTQPMPRNNPQAIVDTAKAGQYLGMKLIYLEAGSGATHPIDDTIISEVKNDINIPLIVGGGIRTITQLQNAYSAGADMVVIGTVLEEDPIFFNALKA